MGTRVVCREKGGWGRWGWGGVERGLTADCAGVVQERGVRGCLEAAVEDGFGVFGV